MLSGVVEFAASLALLQVEYPWSIYAAYSFGKGITLISYGLAALLVAVVAAMATFFCLRAFRGNLLLSFIMFCAGMFVSLSLIAFLLGPAGIDVPGTRLNGIFFSETKFINFIFMVAAPVSVIGAALCGWFARKRAKSQVK